MKDKMKVTGWIIHEGYCAFRMVEGGDPESVADRVAFIEKSARVRIAPYTDIHTDYLNWEGVCRGTGGSGDHEAQLQYGFDPECREACDEALVKMGYELTEETPCTSE